MVSCIIVVGLLIFSVVFGHVYGPVLKYVGTVTAGLTLI